MKETHSEEEENTPQNNNNKVTDTMDLGGFITLFVICMGIGCGIALFEKNSIENYIDFEKKEYKPFIYKNNLYLINIKNGKTYKLLEKQDSNSISYKYIYISNPKAKKKTQIITKIEEDPLNLLERGF